jgi:ABC-type lipoprotein export system ATPase subunit
VSRALVELRDVFRVHRTGQGDAAALQGAELDVLRGEVLCLLGPSGAGKSTLLRVIAGLDTPSAGAVRILGTDIGRLQERARARFRHRHLGLLTQSLEGPLDSALDVWQSVELPLVLRGQGRVERRRRAAELLESVGLHGRGRGRLSELSGGERQRVALCAAIAHRPSLLLADEPTGELDGEGAHMIRQLIVSLARETGMTVLIASHDPATAQIADRTVTIVGGRIAEESRAGTRALVISRGGWLRLPPDRRSEVAGRRRARIERLADRFVIELIPGVPEVPVRGGPETPLPGDPRPADGLEASEEVRSETPWEPARVALRSLTRSYGRGPQQRTVLRDMSHDFLRRGLTVVAGRSGSGKTTLLRLIAGLDLPDAGEVLIDSQPLTGLDREQLAGLRRRRIGYMPQEPATVDFLSALENVVLTMRVRGAEPGRAARMATGLLSALGLAERQDQRVHRLSAGEVQRVALARAMAAARGLLLLDEPTSRLDETNAELVASLIRRVAAHGQTVICATHDPALTEQADQVLVVPQASAAAHRARRPPGGPGYDRAPGGAGGVEKRAG